MQSRPPPSDEQKKKKKKKKKMMILKILINKIIKIQKIKINMKLIFLIILQKII